ncbi:LysR family transcriptional regulator [Robbsia andropogonis]|uniref:LysR family transcriptional regulator n=2 Tax=Robbsia andropogonis TaxID=28092 RepID=A0A0F5K047_9BURK|nr:LysR family transcriptional regulator [Robbsia andropogonis]KKB63458.1 LysR family transcriptional regulator [Robbsia andropogonis]MCP1120713.1 LysR family transcriptional regulator [Robbsia andropogonis]MCP1130447.1 LysR family transcriptional regulator [Robbsia andropogonis]
MASVEGLWVHLHWLVVLSEQGSYTRAAARLHVSKAAMSQKIAELERAAGIALVQRTTRSVRFTDAGERLVESTKSQFEEIASHFLNVREMAGVARGVIRVTAPVAFARQQLVPKMASFLRENPEVKVELEVSDRLSAISTEGFDLAVRHSAHVPDTHVALKLCETKSVIVATREYLEQKGRPEHPGDLARHDCLFYLRARGPTEWAFQPKSEKRTPESVHVVKVDGAFAANNSESLRDAALDGLGIALLPDFTAQAAIRDGRLQILLDDWYLTNAFADQLFVVRPYASQVPRAIDLFTTYLRETFVGGFPLRYGTLP